MALSKKYSVFFFIVVFSSFFLLFVFPDKALSGSELNNAGKKLKEISGAADYSVFSMEKEFMRLFDIPYPGIGAAQVRVLSDCCDEYPEIVSEYISGVDEFAELKFTEHDFNNDGLLDFVARLENDRFCENEMCQLHLFIQNPDSSYRVYNGPKTWGNVLAVSQKKNGFLYDVLFKTKRIGVCIWKWEDGVDQDFACIVGKRIQNPDKNEETRQ